LELYGPSWRRCVYAIIPKLVEDPRAHYLPIYGFDGMAEKLIRSNIPNPVAIRSSKPHFCSLLCAYSGHNTIQWQDFFQILNQKRKVDSSGPTPNNTGFRVP
jgi:hypothetical protein